MNGFAGGTDCTVCAGACEGNSSSDSIIGASKGFSFDSAANIGAQCDGLGLDFRTKVDLITINALILVIAPYYVPVLIQP